MKMMQFFLMQKRMLRKKSFILILCLVIPVVITMRITADQKSGMLTVALAQAGEENPVTSQIMTDLQESVAGINFFECHSQEEARRLVTEKKADAAWIFDSDFESRMEKAGQRGRILPLVTAVQGEDTVFLAYVREILYSKLFPYFSYAAYKSFVEERIPSVSDDDLYRQYSRFSSVPDLFNHETFGSQKVSESYLLSPMRGMLALWLLMCAFAASLYFIQDNEAGSYIWFKKKDSLFFFLQITMIPLVDCALVMFIALIAGGIFTSVLSEILSLCLLVISSILFANLIRRITIRKSIFCASIPVIILITLVLCPIFLKVNNMRPLQLLLPVFYYLNSVYSPYYLLIFAGYTAILFVLNICSYKNIKN